ncbi:MAG: ABC transporter ATP-binding protein [Opitutales bacterium]|nr:ABC transporter ATP-binding protein [Opitutales bacterium]MCH8539611.1 ABC transporter ATP-binding protein/permease [Opitutales bacterium]
MCTSKPDNQEQFSADTLFQFVWSYRRALMPGLFLALARTIVIAPFPFFFQVIIDEHVKSANVAGIISISLMFIGLLFLHWVFTVEGAGAIARVVARMILELRSRIFHKLQFLHFGYLDRQKTGRLLSKYAFDTQNVEQVIMPMLNQLLPNILYSLSIIILLTFLNWQLSLIILAIVPLYFFSRRYFFLRIQAKNRAMRMARERLTGTASEYISALRLVRGYGQERNAIGTIEETSLNYARSRTDQISINNSFGAFATVATQALSLLVVAGGAYMVIHGQLTLGTLFAFMAGLPIILMPVQLFLNFSQQYFVGKEAFYSLRELLTSQYVEDWKGARKPNPFEGRITFENVSFSYDKTSEPAIREVNLDIGAGEHVALVGPSGSGKSTIANLVLGLYGAKSGQILIDGIPQRDINMRWLRRHCAIVMQESLMLSGSIFDNIRFARFDASREEVEEAARLANADEFIKKLPEQYETEVGERGTMLSGGQRQRLSIARAILRDPRILILDEATSALDYESERLIQDALDNLSRGRTVITIAHRLSTVKKADRIIVMSSGQIREQGSYEELSHAQGYFQHLLQSQGN